MAIISNPQETSAPPPGLTRYGLFSAATVSDDLGPREIASGFQFPAEDCGTVRPYDATCVRPFDEKTFDEGLGYQEADPYWVYATRQCGAVGTSAGAMEASVRRRLASGEQRAVEEQLWGGGTLATDPQLTTAVGVTTVVPTAVGSSAAIAALEDAFYDTYGYVGTIHISMRAYGNLAYGNMLERRSGQLTTPMGSVWSIGAGYGITGPLGVAPAAGNVWAFMTPPVLIRRSSVITPPGVATLDRSTNQFMALAERVYAHTWACDSVFAVEVPIVAPAVVSVVV
ncbi:MAG TPA: hypothetical protein VFX97_20590 [Pyrinomonadaceae bacterium]|nr:hypothetical protein [Pyrinomonadaceae bacterium]